jgi:predicted kinase
MLIIFSGLPGTGKSTLAKEISKHLKATYLRIDTIEQAIKSSSIGVDEIVDAGYLVGYSVAKENLSIGRTVITDSVNPIELTRKLWLTAAKEAKVDSVEIEVICSDKKEHQKRVETRSVDIPNLTLPDWQKVSARKYDPWKRKHIIINSAGKSIKDTVSELLKKIQDKSSPY